MLKSKTITIDQEGRDKGRSYILTEMPALKAEKWARHAIAAMSREDLDARGEIQQLGMLGFVLVGMQALAGGKIDQVDALMDDMLPQIKIVEEAVTRPLGGDGDIWELSTLYRLRKELIELHMGFTFAELLLILAGSAPSIPTSSGSPTSPT